MRKTYAALGGAGSILLVFLIGGLGADRTEAYEQYSVNRDATNCRSCHGDFRSSPYTSKVDGQSWGDDLHDVHRNTMLSGDCDVCHLSSGRTPVLLNSAAGGSGGIANLSCTGCHGGSQDGTGTGTVGYGAGLRQMHWRGAVVVCANCHTDSNPANKTVAGENVKPPYYANNGGHTAIPTDPCNPSPTFTENLKATTLGLDNDGNGQFDMADTACNPASAAPGEASKTAPMLVTAYDKLSENVTISYTAACGATNNTIEYGPLSGLSTYAYSGQICAVGNSGAATFNLPEGSFFLVVANNGTKEGSYGTRVFTGATTERPEDTTSVACPQPQDLVNRCDP
jgi:hypothetical protein